MYYMLGGGVSYSICNVFILYRYVRGGVHTIQVMYYMLGGGCTGINANIARGR